MSNRHCAPQFPLGYIPRDLTLSKRARRINVDSFPVSSVPGTLHVYFSKSSPFFFDDDDDDDDGGMYSLRLILLKTVCLLD